MNVSVKNPIRCWQIWEDEPYSIVEKYVKTPPNLELICDPSDSMVVGNRFRREDVISRETGRVWDNWTPGTKFRHIKTGKVLQIYVKVSYKNIRDKIVEEKILLCKEVKETDQLELKGL